MVDGVGDWWGYGWEGIDLLKLVLLGLLVFAGFGCLSIELLRCELYRPISTYSPAFVDTSSQCPTLAREGNKRTPPSDKDVPSD